VKIAAFDCIPPEQCVAGNDVMLFWCNIAIGSYRFGSAAVRRAAAGAPLGAAGAPLGAAGAPLGAAGWPGPPPTTGPQRLLLQSRHE
jgi:hypothetical protein